MEVCENVYEACRLCLHGEGRISVLEEENTKSTITPESIYNCVSIKITKDDRLPKGICESCLSNVNNWCSFKSTCDKTQEKLNSWLNCKVNPDFEEEKISFVNDTLLNRTTVNSCKINCESENSVVPATVLLDNNVVASGICAKSHKTVLSDVERHSSQVRTEEITSTLLGEEENRQSSIVSSTKEIEDTCDDGVCCNINIKIRNIESHEVSGDMPTELVTYHALCFSEKLDNVRTEGVANFIEPIVVSSNTVDDANLSLPINFSRLSSNDIETRSAIILTSDDLVEDSSVDSSQLINEADNIKKIKFVKKELMGTDEWNSQIEIKSVHTSDTDKCLDVRLNEASQSIKESTADQVSFVSINSTDALQDNSNEGTNNNSPEDVVLADTTAIPLPIDIVVPKNDSSPDSDKENSIPNSAIPLTDNSKEKQVKVPESSEQSVEGEQLHSFPELRIESISTLTLDSSEFFPNSQDGKQNLENNTVSENVDKAAASETNENSGYITADKTKSSEECVNIEEAPKENVNTSVQSIIPSPDQDTCIASSSQDMSVIPCNQDSSIASSSQDTAVMEVDRIDSDVQVQSELSPEQQSTVPETGKEDSSPQVMIQNIKLEPIDTHENMPSSPTGVEPEGSSTIFPIRVKSEFSTLEVEEIDYSNSSGLGDEVNKCVICNRKYSSLSNYLKHLQTKVHMYNASLGPVENSVHQQISNESMPSRFLGDSLHNYSNDSFSDDSGLVPYSSDSPMLRSRLCPEEFASPPSRFPHLSSRQAIPRMPYPASLSKLPKRREKCKLCNTTFTYISEMRRHLLSKKHKDNERMLRDNERMMQENRRMIRDNERMIREKERYRRERALLTYRKEESTRIPENTPLPFICPIENCHYSCTKGTRLLAHMKTHGIGQPSTQPTISAPQFTKDIESPLHKPKLSLRQQELLKKELEKRKSIAAAENVIAEPLVYDYKCNGCSKTFMRESGLKKHTYYCSALIAEQQEYEEEEEEEEEEDEQPKLPENTSDNLQIKKMHCPICNLTFAAKSVFIHHVQIYHKGSTLESGLFRPKKTIITSNKLRVKSRKGHGYVCNHCGKKFNLLSSLNFHLKVHTTKHICKICKKGYDSRRAFMDHCRLHFLPPGSKQTLCHKCFRVFKTRGEFYYHRKNDMCSIKLKIYTCNICQHSFKDPKALEEHKVRFHNDALDVSDEEGAATTDHGPAAQNYLSMDDQLENFETVNENRPGTSGKLHSTAVNQSTHSSKSDSFLHCDVCDRDYATLASLKKHMWKYHQTKPLLTRKIDIRRHNVLQANLAKCWKCKHCKKVFGTRRMLVVHLKKCKYNAFDLEDGMCLQCGKWCESGKARICRFCLPDLNKIPKSKKVLAESSSFAITPKTEFSIVPKQEPNSAPARIPNFQGPKTKSSPVTFGGIRLMKCPVGNKYFRSELLMIKHYSQCDGSCENRCSHCRKLFNSHKEYRVHLLNSNCYGSNRYRSKGSRLSLRGMNSFSETESLEIEPSSSQNDVFESTSEINVVDSSISEENSVMEMDAGFASLSDPSDKLVEEKSLKIGRVCTICNKVITMQRGVYRHVYGCFKMYMLTQESVSCKKCSRTFSKHLTMKENTAAIRQHILDCHFIPYYEGEGLTEEGPSEIPPPLLCYVCSFGFSDNDSLKRHILEHRSRKDDVNNVVLLLEAEMLSERRINSEDASSYHIQIQPESSQTLTSQPVRKKNVLSFKVPGSQSLGSRKLIRKKLLQCEKCNRKFTNRNKFFRHKKVHGIVTQSVFHEVSENYLEFIADHSPPPSSD